MKVFTSEFDGPEPSVRHRAGGWIVHGSHDLPADRPRDVHPERIDETLVCRRGAPSPVEAVVVREQDGAATSHYKAVQGALFGEVQRLDGGDGSGTGGDHQDIDTG
jgi:hypothetical protein